jgi:hypothetical protein
VHGRGRRRVIYIRGHRRLCAHYTRRAARERPAAVVTNLPGKLWVVLEFDGSPLDTAAMLGKLWAAWYGGHERTHRISHATQRDLWNRTRHQLDEARAAVGALRRKAPGNHTHGLAPAHAFPTGWVYENGERVILPSTWVSNAYTVAPVEAHRRSKHSAHTAYATAADTFSTVLDELETQGHTALVKNGTPARERVLMVRRHFEGKSAYENVKAGNRAIKRERTDKALVKVGEYVPRRHAAAVEVYEVFELTADGRECTPQTPPVRPYTRGQRNPARRLTVDEENELFGAKGGRAAIMASYRAPHGESVPRRHKVGV